MSQIVLVEAESGTEPVLPNDQIKPLIIPVTCHVSHVSCQLSPVTCHLSQVIFFFIFFNKLVKLVCGQTVYLRG